MSRQKTGLTMETDPYDEKPILDEFDETVGEALREVMVQANTESVKLVFPADVIACLNTLGQPSWKLLRTALRSQEHRIDQLSNEVMALMRDEDLFEWPLHDPHRCVAIGILRVLADKFLDISYEKLGIANPEEELADPADWWKTF
jgi:hypothetical protein